MLKKLLKHEWLETWKIPALILAVILILTAVCALYFYLAPYPAPDVEINVGNMMFFILFAFFDAAATLLFTIYLGIRYYRNLYTDQGYLMHTLPVTPRMLIVSKTVIGVFWLYIAGLVTIVTVLPVAVLALPKLAYMEPEELSQVIPALTTLFGENVWGLLFFFIPYMLVSSIFSVLMLYASISLGQLFGKHKVLSSIICYLGLNALITSVSACLMTPGMTGIVITHIDDADSFLTLAMPEIMHIAYFISFVVCAVISCAFFWLCDYLMSKNLNLE